MARRADPSSADAFVDGLSRVFREIQRILKPDGLVIFTYRHTQSEAWESLGRALVRSHLRVSAVFPVPGEAGVGLHSHKGSGLWDAAFVLRKVNHGSISESLIVSEDEIQRAEESVERWERNLADASIEFSAPDVKALHAALLVAAALSPDHPMQPILPLKDALHQIT
jgi:adenine-specific DNA methylase